MRNADSVERLRAELRQDLAFIKDNHRKNREMTARVDQSDTEDEFLYAALGYTIHNLYKARLIPAKVEFANEAAERVIDPLAACHERFDAFLRDLKRELEEE